ALRDRNQPGVEPDRVGDDESREAEQSVGADVEGDQQPVEPAQHQRFASMSAEISRRNRSRPKPSAWLRISCASNRVAAARAIASAKASADGSSTRIPLFSGTMVSTAPPRPSATTGVPQACASTGTIPKSSSPGISTTAAWRY